MSDLGVQAKEIWDVLSKIDVTEHTEEKEVQGRKFTYLSWAWAWGVLMQHYPDADFRIVEEYVYHDSSVTSGNKREGYVTKTGKTMMVGVEMDIRGVQRAMWLPVMDNKNLAMIDPDARSISDSRMRCLVKVLALYGLGHYIYAGEDVPQTTDDDGKGASAKKPTKKEETDKGGPSEHSRVTFETMSVFVTGCENVKSLEEFWLQNKANLEQMKRESPDLFKDLVDIFKGAKAKLTS